MRIFRQLFILVFSVLIFIVSLTHTPTNALQVLAIESINAKSHWNFMSAVIRALTDNGHNVTVFTPFTEGDRTNYTEVDLSTDLSTIVAMNAEETIPLYSTPSFLIPECLKFSREGCNKIHEHRKMRDILNGVGSTYDIVLSEFLNSECASYVASRLDLPLIYLIPSPMITHAQYKILGHVPNPATTTHYMDSYAIPRTFAQRFWNLIFFTMAMIWTKQAEIAYQKIGIEPYDLAEPQKVSAVFINTHYITDPSIPMPPNVIQIGGIHLKTPASIPDDVLEFIEDSPHGVIYITFGSVVTMSTLPKHIRNAFREALAQVPQRVLWKYEDEMEDKPKNVMIKKWFSQRDILMHPNVKLFISHGGISSVYEAVDAGVPVLGFPLFYDQHRNIDNLVEAGMAISLDLMSTQKDIFLKNVLELVSNEKYTNNAKIASKIFKDRPMSPEQSVVYWTEYIIRHKGAPHLRSHALNLMWYQYFLLDVIAVMLICLFLVLFIIYKILKLLNVYVLKRLQNVKKKLE